jgi:hypothetical protein
MGESKTSTTLLLSTTSQQEQEEKMKFRIFPPVFTLATLGPSIPVDLAPRQACTPDTLFCKNTQTISFCNPSAGSVEVVPCSGAQKCSIVPLGSGGQTAICVNYSIGSV